MGTGYRLNISRDGLDAAVFGDLAAEGRIAQRNGNLFEEENHFDQALRLWRGDALFDMGRTTSWSPGATGSTRTAVL
ncbi:hypothetical protein GCM10009530_17720 [Microbispora corallina]|uniref:Bacterial transcriptional activator domain-containing protein n=1 Tax=Microbispora corallina TaxID=83302 RepID=A0ABQ4FY33_9ACTN|nr:hypothetical protein Mco01_27310 [Microbispora corallina]